jgi:hypothetical protein
MGGAYARRPQVTGRATVADATRFVGGRIALALANAGWDERRLGDGRPAVALRKQV